MTVANLLVICAKRGRCSVAHDPVIARQDRQDRTDKTALEERSKSAR